MDRNEPGDVEEGAEAVDAGQAPVAADGRTAAGEEEPMAVEENRVGGGGAVLRRRRGNVDAASAAAAAVPRPAPAPGLVVRRAGPRRGANPDPDPVPDRPAQRPPAPEARRRRVQVQGVRAGRGGRTRAPAPPPLLPPPHDNLPRPAEPPLGAGEPGGEQGGGGGRQRLASRVPAVFVRARARVRVATLVDAVAVLEEEASSAPVDLTVEVGLPPLFGPIPTPPPDQRAARAAAFRRFVELLADPNGRFVSSLTLQGFRFESGGEFRTDDLMTLFGEVLPNKRGLRKLRVHGCQIGAAYIALLASALAASASWTASAAAAAAAPAPALDNLWLPKVTWDQDGVRAVEGLLSRRDSPLTCLALDLTGVGPEDRQRLCGCLARNKSLTHLNLKVDDVSRSTLDRVAEAMPSLQRLYITGPWTSAALQCFAEKLKTNKSLRSFDLVCDEVNGFGDADPAEVAAPFVDVLERYNYSLQSASFHFPPLRVDTSRIDGCFRRNRRIQRALGRLPPLCPPYYPPLPARLWPAVLEVANGIPPLMYTLLRRGGIHALLQAGQRGGSGGEERPRRRERGARGRIGRRR